MDCTWINTRCSPHPNRCEPHEQARGTRIQNWPYGLAGTIHIAAILAKKTKCTAKRDWSHDLLRMNTSSAQEMRTPAPPESCEYSLPPVSRHACRPPSRTLGVEADAAIAPVEPTDAVHLLLPSSVCRPDVREDDDDIVLSAVEEVLNRPKLFEVARDSIGA